MEKKKTYPKDSDEEDEKKQKKIKRKKIIIEIKSLLKNF